MLIFQGVVFLYRSILIVKGFLLHLILTCGTKREHFILYQGVCVFLVYFCVCKDVKVMYSPPHTVCVFTVIALRSSGDVIKNYYTGYKIHCLPWWEHVQVPPSVASSISVARRGSRNFICIIVWWIFLRNMQILKIPIESGYTQSNSSFSEGRSILSSS